MRAFPQKIWTSWTKWTEWTLDSMVFDPQLYVLQKIFKKFVYFIAGKQEVDMALRVRISPAGDEIIKEALESYRYREKMRVFNQSYSNLKANKKAWDKNCKNEKNWKKL